MKHSDGQIQRVHITGKSCLKNGLMKCWCCEPSVENPSDNLPSRQKSAPASAPPSSVGDCLSYARVTRYCPLKYQHCHTSRAHRTRFLVQLLSSSSVQGIVDHSMALSTAATNAQNEAESLAPTLETLCRPYMSIPFDLYDRTGQYSPTPIEPTRDRWREVYQLRNAFIKAHGSKVDPKTVFSKYSGSDDTPVMMLAFPGSTHSLLDMLDIFRKVENLIGTLPMDGSRWDKPPAFEDPLKYLADPVSILYWRRSFMAFALWVESHNRMLSTRMKIALQSLQHAVSNVPDIHCFLKVKRLREHICSSLIPQISQDVLHGLTVRSLLIEEMGYQLETREKTFKEQNEAKRSNSPTIQQDVEGQVLGRCEYRSQC